VRGVGVFGDEYALGSLLMLTSSPAAGVGDASGSTPGPSLLWFEYVAVRCFACAHWSRALFTAAMLPCDCFCQVRLPA
jgi:hypothetical protein